VDGPLPARIFWEQKNRTILFHYDRRGHFLAENNNADTTLTEYIWLDDMPVAMVT
jgi:hypothetical protein